MKLFVFYSEIIPFSTNGSCKLSTISFFLIFQTQIMRTDSNYEDSDYEDEPMLPKKDMLHIICIISYDWSI